MVCTFEKIKILVVGYQARLLRHAGMAISESFQVIKEFKRCLNFI